MKSSDTTAFTDTQLAAGKIDGTKTKVGLDSMQVVDFSGVGVVDGSKAVTAEDAAKNILRSTDISSCLPKMVLLPRISRMWAPM